MKDYEKILKNNPNNKEIAIKVMKENGVYLKFLTNELKDDEKIVKEATNSYVYSIQYASERIQNNKTFIMTLLNENIFIFRYLQDKMQNDKDVLQMLKFYHSLSNTNINKYNSDYRLWYQEKMQVLRSIEEKEWMDSNMSITSNKIKLDKF